jgi:hypothetical protein
MRINASVMARAELGLDFNRLVNLKVTREGRRCRISRPEPNAARGRISFIRK